MKKMLMYNGELTEFEISYDIQVGDTVYNITYGGGEHPEGFDIEDEAVMLDLHYSDYIPYECHTTHGYGPKEDYFKILN